MTPTATFATLRLLIHGAIVAKGIFVGVRTRTLLLWSALALNCGCQDFDAKSQLAITWAKNQLAQRQAMSNPTFEPVIHRPTYQRPAEVPTDTPQQAAMSFLDAIRFGDEPLAQSLLTSAAQIAVQQQNRSIRFPGSPTAIHRVDQVEFPDPDVAHVWCIWCDASRESRKAARMILIQRQELAGWRVAGLVFLDDQGNFGEIVNFEEHIAVASND